MKHIYYITFFAIVLLSACSASRSTQSGDSYYGTSGSSGKYVGSSKDGYYNTGASDQYVQMRVQDPARWSYFDEYDTYADPYSPFGGMGGYYGMGYYGYGAPWLSFGYWSPFSYCSSYFAWNSFYNPYYGSVVVVNSKYPASGAYTQLRPFSQGSYFGNTHGANGSMYASSYSQPYYRGSALSRNGSDHFYNPNTNYNSYRPAYNNAPVRSYTPSSSFGGSSGGSFRGGGGGRVR